MHIDWTRTSLRLAANPLAVARHVESLPSIALCILRLLDGHKTVQDTLDMSPVDEPTARAILQRLTELGLATPVGDGAPTSLARYKSLSAPLQAWMAASGSRPSSASTARRDDAPRPAPSGMDDVDALFAELDQSLPEPRGTMPPPVPVSLSKARPPALPRASAPPPTPASLAQIKPLVPPRAPVPKRPMAATTSQASLASRNSLASLARLAKSAPPPAPELAPLPKVLAAFPPKPNYAKQRSTLENALRCHLGEAPQEAPQESPGWTEQDLAFFNSYAPEEPMTDTFSDLLSRPRKR